MEYYCGGSASKTSLKPMETMQMKALRIIGNTSWDSHTTIFKELKILKFPDIFMYRLCFKRVLNVSNALQMFQTRC